MTAVDEFPEPLVDLARQLREKAAELAAAADRFERLAGGQQPTQPTS